MNPLTKAEFKRIRACVYKQALRKGLARNMDLRDDVVNALIERALGRYDATRGVPFFQFVLSSVFNVLPGVIEEVLRENNRHLAQQFKLPVIGALTGSDQPHTVVSHIDDDGHDTLDIIDESSVDTALENERYICKRKQMYRGLRVLQKYRYEITKNNPDPIATADLRYIFAGKRAITKLSQCLKLTSTKRITTIHRRNIRNLTHRLQTIRPDLTEADVQRGIRAYMRQAAIDRAKQERLSFGPFFTQSRNTL